MAIAEFIVPGTPISVQTKSPKHRAEWKGKIAAAAAATLPDPYVLVADSVRITIVYFYVSTDLDLDNIIKPILDALNEVIYLDDSQIVNISAAKRDLAGTLVLENVSPVLIGELSATVDEPRDFVFIGIELANLGTLL